MPITPINYRADDPFLPLTDVDKIDKDDFAPATAGAISTGRARVGTWLEFTGSNMQKPASGAEVLQGAAPTWSDYDSQGVSGHPDSFRLSLLTMLLGAHRGKTQYYVRQAFGYAGAFDPSLAAGDVGSGLTVWGGLAADVTVINTAFGSTIVEAGDGLLGLASDVSQPNLGILLRGPDASGYIEYLKY